MNLLFVCRANTGRSQIAEALFNKYSSGKNHATSAGTLVNNKEHSRVMDRPNIEPLLRSMNDLGIDIAHNLRKEITPEIINAADRIFLMAEPETIPDYLKDSDKVTYWDVPDPKNMEYEEICKIRDVIDAKVKALIEELI
jgi:protein-tyrosine-phosphatase